MKFEHSVGRFSSFRILRAVALGLSLLGVRNVSASCLPPASGLIGWWTGDGNANDSQSTNHGILQGGATATNAGFVNRTFTFDGTNSYVQIPDAPALRPTNLTIEAWVRFSSLDSAGSGAPAGDQYLVFKQNSRAGDFEGFDLSKRRGAGKDVFRFMVTSAAGSAVEIDSVTALSTNTWYHVAAVRGTNFTQLYVNGQLEAQTNVTFAQDYGAFPLYFGTSGQAVWDRKLKGALDEVSLYNHALVSNEIAAIYLAGAAGKCKAGSGLTITNQPHSQIVAAGEDAVFSVTAAGVSPLSYQWLFGGVAIPGATNALLDLAHVRNDDEGAYSVVVTNAFSAVTSIPAALTVKNPPIMALQPQSETLPAGATAVFSAAASGDTPMASQWRLDGAALANSARISGANGNTLTITGVQPADAGAYTYVATNAVGTTVSFPATLTVIAQLAITVPPASQCAAPGRNTSFGALASGPGPLGYQWQFNGVPISGAQDSVLSLNNVQYGNAGGYCVVVTNATAAVTSAVAVLTVMPPPVIMSQPHSATVSADASVTFNSAASGGSPLSFHWRRNGVTLANSAHVSGATSGVLTITGAQPADAGTYTLIVTNAVGIAASSAASLVVLTPPNITVPPASRTVNAGSNVAFNVTASGTAPLAYQWLFGGAPISGATASLLTVTNAQTASAGSYAVIVSNSLASVTSAVAVLTIRNPPLINPQPLGGTNIAGTTATFVGGASGDAPIAYQWFRNGVGLTNSARVSGVTNPTLIITSVQAADAGSYTLAASNSVGTALSLPALFTVLTPPTITAPPLSQSLNAGSNANFFVTATGSAPLTYQWRMNGTNLSDSAEFLGSATPSLFIGAVQTNDAGSYSVVVANAAGSVTSAPALLNVVTSGSCLPAPAGLIGWWSGEGDASDSVGPDSGSLQGGATIAAGRVGQAFSFDGTNNFVSIPDFTILKQPIFTLEAWVRFSSLDSGGSGAPAGDQYIIFKQNTRSGDFEGIDLSKVRKSGSDLFRFLVSSATAQSVEIDSVTVLTTNVWYHVAAVRGTNFVQLYVNGVLEKQATVTFPQDYGTAPLYFGTSGLATWDRRFKGLLDEVSLFNRPLSSTEVAAIYNAGAAGKCKSGTAPAIYAQPAAKILTSGGTATFTVGAVGTGPLAYQWQKDGFKLNNGGNISGASTASLTLSNLTLTDIGNYQAIVGNGFGSATSMIASLTTGIPPANDAFASAQAISGSSGSMTANNANGTKQSGEPNHAGKAGGASVWYNWTAPSGSPVTIDTAMSAFDTLLAVYTGSSVSGLTQIASNDNSSTNTTRSRVTFTPVSGTVYRIAVDGAGGATGNLTLRWVQANVALPDLTIVASAVSPQITTETFGLNSCAVVEGLVAPGTRRLIRFDTETENQGNADLYFGDAASNPLFVWAACHAHYHFNNYMAYRLLNANGGLAAIGLKVGFCVLDVFRWKSGAASNAKYSCSDQGIQVGWGDLYDRTLDGQWIDITGLPDGNYTIEIEPNPQGIIQESNYGNNVVHVPITIGNPNAAPANNNFASAQTLLGGFSSVSGTTANATKQANEPNHAGNAGGKSVWYAWTSPDSKAVTIDTLGSSFNTLLAVYTGTSLAGLQVVATNDDAGPGVLQSKVTFSAVAGTTYQIAVDGFNGASGNLILTLTQTIQNNNFNNPEFIGGVTGVAHGSNAGGTKESGEPNHAGNAGGASIWYAWTAPIHGIVTFDTTGSTFNTLLAAYTGSTVNLLTPVASNDDIDPLNGILQSRLSFNAVGLSRYYIAVDGFNGATGNTTLTWSLQAGGSGLAGGRSATPRANVANVFLPGGELQLVITGQPDQRYLIERSCDLATWTPLVTTLANDSGIASFVDKSTMHLDRQGSATDVICGAAPLTGAAFTPGVARFYRATALGVTLSDN